MEDPRPKLQAALKEAMRSRDNERRDVIRLAQSAIKQVEVDSRKDLSAEDVVAILQKEAKMQRESIAEMRHAGRDADATQSEKELDILEGFLPQQMSREEIAELAKKIVDEVGANSPGDMGKVMGKLMPQVKGRADGNLVNQVVRELLNQAS